MEKNVSPSSQSIDDDIVLREKLAVDERLLRRLCKHFTPANLASNSEPESSILADLRAYDFAMRKTTMSLSTLIKDIGYYRQCITELAEQSAHMKELIAQRKTQLITEEENVHRRQGYDRLAEKVAELPRHEDVRQDMQKVSQEIERVKEQVKQTDIELEVKRQTIRAYINQGYQLISPSNDSTNK